MLTTTYNPSLCTGKRKR